MGCGACDGRLEVMADLKAANRAGFVVEDSGFIGHCVRTTDFVVVEMWRCVLGVQRLRAGFGQDVIHWNIMRLWKDCWQVGGVQTYADGDG